MQVSKKHILNLTKMDRASSPVTAAYVYKNNHGNNKLHVRSHVLRNRTKNLVSSPAQESMSERHTNCTPVHTQ